MNDDQILPVDVVFEILSRLPVKTLIRFTLVCKSWSSLIRNPEFLAARQRYTGLSRCNEKRLFLYIKGNSYALISDEHAHEQLTGTFPAGLFCSEILGRSCNGLVCLKMTYNKAKTGIFLWNPLIQKFKALDTFPYMYTYDDDDCFLYGLGYHEPCKDHRVVRVSFTEKSKKNKVDIYSMSTDSWRTVEGARVPRRFGKQLYPSGLYLNGAVHWLTKKRVEDYLEFLKSIVSFNFIEETFHDMVLPSELQADIDFVVDINEFKGSLAILIAEDFSGGPFYLWVMNENGVAESWTKTILMVPVEFSKWPQVFMKDGMILVKKRCNRENNPLVLYDLKDGKSKKIGNLELGHPELIVDFTESLVLLDKEDGWFDTPNLLHLFEPCLRFV
ncbi:hypothetical protein ACH5RR_022846 [Cinchona calisaya]|uniref:F-box domain-containing protein n=1 Tax=Cinchona calisaya TaxID=153742 RepID=A0ABD2ZA23_9GENT